MGIIRNFIEVVGIAQEEDLPEKSFGQLVKYSEAEQIIIPREKLGVKDIYQIGLKVEIKSKRVINTADCKTVIIDGAKNFKIVCTQHENPDKVVMISLQQPYNTFIEVPNQIKNVENIHVHILDAYFEVLEKRRIYGHFVYLVDVRYSAIDMGAASQKTESKANFITVELDVKNSETQIALSHENFLIWDDEEYGKAVEPAKPDIAPYNDDIDCEYL